uniref:Uncharacterized protein n=1 Tax=Arundo donax TaxID=35708 RepID=A0A0A9AFR4_ARUDO
MTAFYHQLLAKEQKCLILQYGQLIVNYFC